MADVEEDVDDPLQRIGGDPWVRQNGEDTLPREPDERLPVHAPGVYTESRPRDIEPPAQRIIHDVPPVWNGQKPETQAEPYLKLLAGWLATTRTQKKQQGMTILQYADGDLKILINELEIDVLTDDTSGQLVFDHIKAAFEEYIDKPLANAFEQYFFSADGKRKRNESMLLYIARKNTLCRELERAKCSLPSEVKGYMMLRDAQIGPRAWDQINGWTKGNWEHTEVVKCLKRLERPVPGSGQKIDGGLTAWVAYGADTPGNLSESSGGNICSVCMNEAVSYTHLTLPTKRIV